MGSADNFRNRIAGREWNFLAHFLGLTQSAIKKATGGRL